MTNFASYLDSFNPSHFLHVALISLERTYGLANLRKYSNRK